MKETDHRYAWIKYGVRLSLGVSFVLLLSASAWAGSLNYVSVAERVERADNISHVRCTEVTSQWRNGKIFTVARFAVLDEAIGRDQSTLEITTLGGRAVHPVLQVQVVQEVANQVNFEVGEELVLFSRLAGADQRVLVAGQQGVVRIDSTSRSGEKIVKDTPRKLQVERRQETESERVVGNKLPLMIRHQRHTVSNYLEYIKSIADKSGASR